MTVFYILVSVMPFVQHPFWSLFVGDLTMVKITGVGCLVYATVYFLSRSSPPTFFATVQARLAIIFVLIGIASFLAFGAPVPLAVSPMFSYLSFLGLFFITLTVVDSQRKLRFLLLVAVSSIGYASLHTLREWQKAGFSADYRPGWVTGDPNYYSLSVLLCLPFAYYLLRPRQPRWERYLCMSCLGVTLLAFIAAASRGGLLGLVASGAIAAWRSPRRWRWRFVSVGLVLLPLMAVSPSSPVSRLFNPNWSDDYAANVRTALWSAGIRMAEANPLTGVGVGNFKAALRRYENPGDNLFNIAHNTYIEIAAEMGIPALALFLALLTATFLSMGRVRLAARRAGAPLIARAAEGIQVGLGGYAVAIFFVSAEYQKLFWFLLFLSMCLPALLRQHVAARRRAAARAMTPSVAVQPAVPEPPSVGNEVMRQSP
jgi:O-antigen ligase